MAANMVCVSTDLCVFVAQRILQHSDVYSSIHAHGCIGTHSGVQVGIVFYCQCIRMHWIVVDFLVHMIFLKHSYSTQTGDKRARYIDYLCEDETQTFSLVGIFLLLQQQHKLCVIK